MTTELQAAAAEIEHKNEPAAPSSDVEKDIGTIECIGRCLGGAFERDLLTHAKLIRAHIASLEEGIEALSSANESFAKRIANLATENKRLREALQSGNNTYLGGQYIVCIKPEIVEAALAQTDGLKECRVCDGAGYHLIPTTGHGCCGSFLSSGECCGNAVQVDTGLEEQPCIACDGTGKESLAQTDGKGKQE